MNAAGFNYRDSLVLRRILEKIKRCEANKDDCTLNAQQIDGGIQITATDHNSEENITITYEQRTGRMTRTNNDAREVWTAAPSLDALDQRTMSSEELL